MRRKVIAGNWKMNKLPNEALDFITELEPLVKNSENEIVLCVPYIDLFYTLLNAQGTNIKIGAQNMHWEKEGAYTGEISSEMLKAIGVEYVIIGHSERRKYFNDDNYIADKIKLALKNDIIPVLCIGESLEEYENNLTKDRLKEQIDIALKDNISNKIIIAYEPIWSIGTGKIPTNDILTEIISFIKNYINENYQINLKVIYGGSVNLNNILELNKINNLDGYLIGGATLNPYKFLELIDKIK